MLPLVQGLQSGNLLLRRQQWSVSAQSPYVSAATLDLHILPSELLSFHDSLLHCCRRYPGIGAWQKISIQMLGRAARHLSSLGLPDLCQAKAGSRGSISGHLSRSSVAAREALCSISWHRQLRSSRKWLDDLMPTARVCSDGVLNVAQTGILHAFRPFATARAPFWVHITSVRR